MSDWNAAQYTKFETQRTQPSVDLISRLGNISPAYILDVGCGPGNSSYALKQRFKDAAILGIDSSEDMLQKARQTYPGMQFSACRVPQELDSLGTAFDLIFSNACIHWIPEQEQLLGALFSKLNSGGTLAVQIPLIQESAFYRMLYAFVPESEWSGSLSGIRCFYNLLPEQYYDVLSALSCDFDIWQTTYYHTVTAAEDIAAWYQGSGLRPYLDALNASEQSRFLRSLTDRIKTSYPVQKDGHIILKMPRLFFTVRKPA